VNSEFQQGAAFLRELGLENQAEIARIIDIATNPNSLFVQCRDPKRAINDSVRTMPRCVNDTVINVQMHTINLSAEQCDVCNTIS
jgi:hypothetical protein